MQHEAQQQLEHQQRDRQEKAQEQQELQRRQYEAQQQLESQRRDRTLTIDHRVLDGYQANAFLARWVEEIEGWR
jgi:hypothetical protein